MEPGQVEEPDHDMGPVLVISDSDGERPSASRWVEVEKESLLTRSKNLEEGKALQSALSTIILPIPIKSLFRIKDPQEGVSTIEFADIYQFPRLFLQVAKAFMGGVGTYKIKVFSVALPPFPSSCTAFKLSISAKFKWTDKEVTIHLVPWPAVCVRELRYTFPLHEGRDLLFRQ